MNKVFKVIWSEARNAYVVVSEMAKSHGTKSCSTKKLLAMLIATGVMTCASMAPAMAANPAPDDKNVTIGKGAVSAPYDKQTGNVAIGENAKAWNGTGRQEAYVDFGQGGIKGDLFGATVKDGTKLPGSIAIGKNTVARSGSTMIGDHGYTGKIGDITIAPDGNGIMKYNNDVYSTTIGANSFNSGALASVTGAFSIASSKYDGSGGFNSFYAVQNTGATVYGSLNSIESATSNSSSSGIASSVLGFANRTQNANAALIWGTGNEVTNSIENIDIKTDWNKLSVTDAQKQAIKAMQSSKYAGGSVLAIGGGNKADYTTYSELTGVQNKVTGTKAKAAKYDFVNGYQNTVTEASDVTVIGSKNKVTADGNKVIGDNHKVSGKDNVIFGSADQLTETTVNNAVVLGHNAKVTGEGGVALGSGSVADRANAVSVGRKDANRQIINVAAGTEATDAVNVSQLQKVSDTANAGWNLSTNGVATEATNVKPSDFVDFSGDQNVSISKDAKGGVNTVKVELNKDLTGIETISNDGASLTLNGTATELTNGKGAAITLFGDTTTINNKVTVYKDGRIAGVAAGINDKDAVNVSQLKNSAWKLAANGVLTEAEDVKAGDYVDFSGDQNVSISKDAKGGVNTVKVELNKDLTGIETISNDGASLTLNGTATELTNGKGAAITLFGDTTTINNKVTVYKDGRIAGVAAGINDKDAVNVGQLNAVGATANKGWNLATNGVATEATNVKPGDFVDFSGDQNVSISKDAKGGVNTVKVELNKDLTGIETISNDGASLTLNGTATELTNGKGAAITLFGDTTTINNKVTVYKDGRIAGVAAGINDKDAVNVGQLNAVGATANKGWNLATNGVATEATNVKPGDYVDFSGDQNVSISKDAKGGVNTVKVELNKDLTGIETISNDGASLTLNGTATELTNGKGAAITLFGDTTTINNKVTVYKDGRIAGVAAGINDKDAVNVGQLNAVGATANKGWNLATNGVATEATNVKPGDYVDFSGDQNVSISKDAKGGVNTVKVELNKDLTGIETISNDGASLTLNGTATELTNGKGAAITLFGDTTTINNKVTVYKDGRIAGVAAGINDKDAVNVGQLNAVGATANKGWNLATNGVATEATNVKPGDYVDFSGDQNVSISKDAKGGVNTVKVELNKDLTGIETISNDGASLTLNGTATELTNGKGAAITLFGDTTTINNKVTVYKDGRIAGVAAGINDKDAVNVGQLNAVGATANKGWNLATNGVATEATNVKPGEYVDFSGDKNISVSHDGTKVKVELNKNIDVNYVQTNALNSKYNLSVGTMAENGIMPFLVNSTGAFYAAHNKFSVDKDGKVTATAGEIGNVVLQNGVYTGNSALRDGELYVGDADGNYSQITTKGAKLGKVTVAEDGKISGVAAGVADTDAVNVGQLKEAVQAGNTDTHIKPGEYGVGADNKVNMDVVDKNGNKVDTVTIKDVAKASDVGNVNNIASDIKNQDGSHTTVVDAVNNLNQKLDNKVGDLNYVEGGKGNYVTNGENTTTSIGKLDQALKDVAATAAKHTTVTQGDNITVTPGTNTDGSKNYNVALKKDITVESVTANTFKADQTVMNKDGLKVGNKVSVSATAVTAGKTSISDEGVKVGDKTYISDKGLNANEQKVTNVDAGELSATSKDAVNGSQLYETNQAIANNATNISSLSHSISNLDNRVNKVGAGAAALAALHPLDFDPDAKWDFAAGYGNYRGANAAAVGAYYRPNEDTMFSVGGTFGNGENMVNAGVSFKLGSGSSHVSTSRVAMAKEIKELRSELEAMKSAMLDANAGKKIDTSKLQLFPDVPQNHWAYEYVAQLAGNGMIEGYPDGNFAGDRPMTRYEFAAILYRAMTKGAVLSDKLLSEFSHELEYFTVDTIAKDKAGNPTIQRVRTVKENKNK